MPHRFALLAVLGLGTAALAAEPLVLEALTSTSGRGADLLLDGDPATGWSPEGDAEDEGVLLRFEQPLSIDGVSLRACTGSPAVKVTLYLDGAKVLDDEEVGPEAKPRSFSPVQPRSVFVRVQSASGKVCLGDLRLLLKGTPVAISPPRQVPGSLVASSVLAPQDAFLASFLFDSRLDFGWAEGAKGPGTGQSFTLTLEAPVELVALDLWNGYQRSEDHFRKNARAKQLAVSVDGGPSVSLAVKDTSGVQRLPLPAPLKGRVWTVRVEGVYPGKSYPDLVLSELRLVDARGPFGLSTPEADTRQQALRTRLAKSPLGKVVDRSWHGVCSSTREDSKRRLKLRSQGTFVFYEDAESTEFAGSDDSDHRTEVFDGAWVMKNGKGPWVSVELFGRRHRIEKHWAPYADQKLDKDTVRIAGGSLEVARVADLDADEFQAYLSDWSTSVQSERVDCVKRDKMDQASLVAREAVFVRGKAITDLFARP